MPCVVADDLSEISIHALREEGDRYNNRMPRRAGDFYPRPPRGGRPFIAVVVKYKAIFLSTPSARRATPFAPVDDKPLR